MSDGTLLSIEASTRSIAAARQAPVHAVKDARHGRARGEIVALLGSSGCGKTSTLRMIAGFEDVTRGRDRARRPARSTSCRRRERNVAMAFEGYSLYPPLTVRDNIALRAEERAQRRARGCDSAVGEIAAAARDRAISSTAIRSSISGGQQQRASLARALVRRRRSLSARRADGPARAAAARGPARPHQEHYLIERRMTAIFVTHDQTEANALADRIAVMEGGRAAAIRQPEGSEGTAGQSVRRQLHRRAADERVRSASVNATTAASPVGRTGRGFRIPRQRHSPGVARTRSRRRASGRDRHPAARGSRSGSARTCRPRVVSNQWLGDQTPSRRSMSPASCWSRSPHEPIAAPRRR